MFNIIANFRISRIDHTNAKCAYCGTALCLYHTHQCTNPKCQQGRDNPSFYPLTRKTDGKPIFKTKLTLKPVVDGKDKDNQERNAKIAFLGQDARPVEIKLTLFGNEPMENNPSFAKPHPLAPWILYGRTITLNKRLTSKDLVFKNFPAPRRGVTMVEWDWVLNSKDELDLSHTREEVDHMDKLLPLPSVDAQGNKSYPDPLRCTPFTPKHPGDNSDNTQQVQQAPVQQGAVSPMTPQAQNFYGGQPQLQVPGPQVQAPQTQGVAPVNFHNPPQTQPAMVQGPATIPAPVMQPVIQQPVVETSTAQDQTQAAVQSLKNEIEDPFAS